MNRGPLLFLSAFFALASSWFGYVLTPELQLGRMQPTNTVPAGITYPLARPGLARQGLEVYRANGCAACHSQQVGQTATVCDVLLTELGTNQPALLAALAKVKTNSSEANLRELFNPLPATIDAGLSKEAAEAEVKGLSVGGAKAQISVRPTGPDIERGWGKRRTVAEDFLYDYPVMLGQLRIGPDLANIGARSPGPNWHLLHLYSPRLEVAGSTMPPYRFLFERRKINRARSPEALAWTDDPDYEIVPGPEAKALVAYLLSLRSDAPLFDAPLTPMAALANTNPPAK